MSVHDAWLTDPHGDKKAIDREKPYALAERYRRLSTLWLMNNVPYYGEYGYGDID
jgi:hypothetical protein